MQKESYSGLSDYVKVTESDEGPPSRQLTWTDAVESAICPPKGNCDFMSEGLRGVGSAMFWYSDDRPRAINFFAHMLYFAMMAAVCAFTFAMVAVFGFSVYSALCYWFIGFASVFIKYLSMHAGISTLRNNDSPAVQAFVLASAGKGSPFQGQPSRWLIHMMWVNFLRGLVGLLCFQQPLPLRIWYCLSDVRVMGRLMPVANVGALTAVFVESAQAATQALGTLTLAQRREGPGIDWPRTCKNIQCMTTWLGSFSKCWAFYFFVGEFNIVIGLILGVLGLVEELVPVVRAEDIHDPEFLEALARVFFITELTLAGIVIVVTLWCTASDVTDACSAAKTNCAAKFFDEALRGDTCDCTNEYQHAKRLEKYMADTAPGFSAAGITVSYGMGAQVLYPALAGFFTFAAPIIKERLHFDITKVPLP